MGKISSICLHFPIFAAWNRDPRSLKFPRNRSSQCETFPEDWNRAGLNPSPIPTAFFGVLVSHLRYCKGKLLRSISLGNFLGSISLGNLLESISLGNESRKGACNCPKAQGMLSLEKGEENHQNMGKANYFQQNIPKTISSSL